MVVLRDPQKWVRDDVSKSSKTQKCHILVQEVRENVVVMTASQKRVRVDSSKNSKTQKCHIVVQKVRENVVVMTDPQKRVRDDSSKNSKTQKCHIVRDEPSKNSKCQKCHNSAQKVREKCSSEGGSSKNEFRMIRRKNWKFAKMFQFWLDERISLKITDVEFKLWKKSIKNF